MELIDTNELRELPEYHSINFKGIGELRISYGKVQTFNVSASEKILDNLFTQVRNGVLSISYKSFFPVELLSSHKLIMYVTTPHIKELIVSGAGKIIGDSVFPSEYLHLVNGGVGSIRMNIEAKQVELELSGVGKIELTGHTESLSVELTGAGKVNTFELSANEVQVLSRGVGKCCVQATQKLDAQLKGVGKIEYKGNPPVFNCNRSGLGNIEKVG